jgi:hypothetical protein
MSVADLERQLRELGGEIAYPRTPNLARAVRARIRPRPAWRRWRVVLAAAAVVLIAAAGAIAINPDARRTVAGFLGLPGFQFQKVKVLPSPSPYYGTRGVTLDDARRLAGFTVLTPGSPEKIRSVVFDDRPPGGEVELDLESGAIVTEVKGGINTGFFGKMIGPNGQVTEVAVGGSTGYWITGAESIFVYQDATGQFRSDELRRSGDTLVFVRNGVIVRIEGAKNQADALRIAGLVR